MFSDITDQFEVLGRAMHTQSDVYERGRAQLDETVWLDPCHRVDRKRCEARWPSSHPRSTRGILRTWRPPWREGLLVHDDHPRRAGCRAPGG